ncbi:MAG: hypothetical protein AAB620_02615 [Patescibacteria group bacterium]
MKNHTKVFLIVFSLLLPAISLAAGLVPCGNPGDAHTTCTFCDIFALLKGLVDFVIITLVPISAVLLLTAGGAMFIFSGGNPGLTTKGRSIMTAVVWGLVIIYCAWLLVNTFLVLIGLNDLSFGSWKMSEWFVIKCSITP